MSDQALRELERRVAHSPEDEAAVEAYDAALGRAGRPTRRGELLQRLHDALDTYVQANLPVAIFVNGLFYPRSEFSVEPGPTVRTPTLRLDFALDTTDVVLLQFSDGTTLHHTAYAAPWL